MLFYQRSVYVIHQKAAWYCGVISVFVFVGVSSLSGTCQPSQEANELKRIFERFRISRDFDPHFPNPMEIMEDVEENCPHLNPRVQGVSVQSLCPWEYYQHHSENRYPAKLWYARCMCSRCLGTNYRCRAVYHNVAVIREQCLNGTYDFFWDTEPIPVGCTCIHEPIRRVANVKRTWPNLLEHKLNAHP